MRINKQNAIIGVILLVLAGVLLAVCIDRMYMGTVFSNIIGQDRTKSMYLELAVYAGLLLIGLPAGRRCFLPIIAVLLFTYSHSMLLPMLCATLYTVQIVTTGRMVLRLFSGRAGKSGVYDSAGLQAGQMSFVMLGESLMAGIAVNLVAFGALSLAGIGQQRVLITVVAALGIVGAVVEYNALKAAAMAMDRFFKAYYEMGAVGCLFLMLLIGRAPISADYDSLWYGLRSLLVLDNGQGIYENMAMTGCVYQYPKGFEILALPMASLTCYGYTYAFNIILGMLIAVFAYATVARLTQRRYAVLAAIAVLSTPGIMNMTTTAKPDIATLLIQVIGLYYGVMMIRVDGLYLFHVIAVFVLSLAFKPTAILFSPMILFPTVLLYLWKCRGKRHGPFGGSTVRLLVLGLFALAGVWLRTYWSTGLPATSVWTNLFLKLGFRFRYPYSATNIGSVNFVPWSVAFSRIPFFINRVYQFFTGPIDMDHVVIAWGSCLVSFLALINLWSLIRWGCARITGRRDALDGTTTTDMGKRFLLILWAINLLAALGILFIGGGVDGNYFMLFYVCTLLSGVVMIDRGQAFARICIWLMIAFNLVVMGTTNWAWTTGFSERSWVNPGYYDNRAVNRAIFEEKGLGGVYNALDGNSRDRVIVFTEDDPTLFYRLPCNAEPLLDIFYWGNPDILSGPGEWLRYLDTVRADYLLIERGYIRQHRKYMTLIDATIDAGYIADIQDVDAYLLLKIGGDRADAVGIQDIQSRYDAWTKMQEYQFGEPVTFGNEGYAVACSNISEDGWTAANESGITFFLPPDVDSDMSLHIEYTAAGERQTVRITSNGQVLADFFATGHELRDIIIPRTCVKDDRLEIVLELPDAVRPDNGDYRLLGLHFDRATLTADG